MKVRVIKTSEGYIPQVFTKDYGYEEPKWYSLSKSGAVDALWISPEHVFRFCPCFTQWGAKQVLEKYLNQTMKKTKKLADFKKELDQPNVVYEAEV